MARRHNTRGSAQRDAFHHGDPRRGAGPPRFRTRRFAAIGARFGCLFLRTGLYLPDRLTAASAIFFHPDQIAGEGRDSCSAQLQTAVLVMPGLPESLRSYRIVRPVSSSSPLQATQVRAST